MLATATPKSRPAISNRRSGRSQESRYANTGATRSGILTVAGGTLAVTQTGSDYVRAQSITLASATDPAGVAGDSSGSVLIKTRRRCSLLPIARIAAVQAADNYSYVVCVSGQRHVVRRSLKQWRYLLPSDGFVIVDRSWLVNWRAVSHWVVRGRGMEVYVGRLGQPLKLGRAAAQRFKTEVIPRIERGRGDGEQTR